MADHATKQFLDSLKTIISGGSTLAGTDVYTGRVSPFAETELPAIRLHVDEEGLSPLSMGTPYHVQRQLSVEIELTVQKLDDYDVDAYTLLKQIEHLLATNPTVGGKARQLTTSEVTWERDIEANQTIARVTLRCDAIVVVLNNAVDVPI